MKLGGFAIKFQLICAGFLAGVASIPMTTQAACTLPGIWPNWDVGPDHYYTAANWPVSLGGIARDDGAGYCPSVFAFNHVVDVDGNLDLSGNTSIPWPINLKVYPEGPHVAHINFEYGYNSNPAEWTHKTFEKPFYVDGTKPVITFDKPQNNAIIASADALITGNVTEDASKLGSISVTLGVTSGLCWFKQDLLGNNKNSNSIAATYCSEGMGTHCNVPISPVLQFPLNYNLNDYVDFSAGQDCAFFIAVNAADRVGNGTVVDGVPLQSRSFTVDQAPPSIMIMNPVAVLTDISWNNPDDPIISGTVEDLSDVSDVWITIKDETANRWWDGTAWRAEKTKVSAVKTSGTKTITWKYNGLTREVMRSGIFTITASASDKFGHVGQALISGINKKKQYLGNKDFTVLSLRVNNVSNIGALAKTTYSFTTEDNENTIFVSAKITPSRLAGVLSNYGIWDVVGKNGDSGQPNAPHSGIESIFIVQSPPIPVRSAGRLSPMGYAVYAGIEYDFEGEHIKYFSLAGKGITQDNLDTLRQEYSDLRTGYYLNRASFDQALPIFPVLLQPKGAETEKHLWHILKFLNTKATALNDSLKDKYLVELNPSSGYRCPIGNKAVGGEYNSNHMLGRALDGHVNFCGVNWEAWA